MMHQDVLRELKALSNPEKARVLRGFFKCGPGEYGEGDEFLGVTMPEARKVAKRYKELALAEVEPLLGSRSHEARMTGLLILTYAFERGDAKAQREIYDFYLAHRSAVNNWDLVDVTTPNIVGTYLVSRPAKDRKFLYRYAQSKNLWERRIAILATFAFLRSGQYDDTVRISEMLLDDTHDLIHKAVGWMLREMGKRDPGVLEEFLAAHAARMPRTMLRYAIEKFPKERQQKYLRARQASR